MAYKDDGYYIGRIRDHADRSAFAALVTKHKTMAFNIALKVTGNREEAEETAQDAFVKIYHALDQFRGDSKFTTWLYRIVYNLALARIRKKTLFTGSTDDETFQETDSAGTYNSENQQKEIYKYLHQAIRTLDAGDQLLITLYYMDEQPVQEVAAITGISESNAKVRLFRLRKKLQETMEQMLGDELQTFV